MKHKALEEAVEVWSIDPARKMATCRLAVGAHGLPVLITAFPATQVWDFPAAWTLRATGATGLLLGAWWAMQGIQEELRRAEMEAEHNG